MDGTVRTVGGGTRVEVLDAPNPRGGVVLIGEVSGVDAVLRGYARRLVDEGYTVAMPDLWWRRGRPPLCGPEAVSAAVAQLVDSEALIDVGAARTCLPAGRPVFVMGFCVGGLYARLAACTQVGLAGAVEFYGRVVYPAVSAAKPAQPLDFLPGLGCPIQCHYGVDDPICPPAHVDELERRLALRPHPFQVCRYPGCGHAFLNPERPGWQPEAAATAWGRARTFLDQLASAAG